MDVFRHWIEGTIDSKTNDGKTAKVPAPGIALVLSGDVHTFQMFAPSSAKANLPTQLIVGNGGDVLEPDKSYPDAYKTLMSADANLFEAVGKLWMRNSFGFAMLEKPDKKQVWTATLYDIDGKAIAECDLRRSGNGCK